MKKIFLMIGVSLLIGLQSFALSSAEDLKTSAQLSQKDLIESIEEVSGQLSEITSRRSFDEYFALIEVFLKAAEDFDLDLIYPEAVESLASKMVSHGNRWLQIEVDSVETILSYQKWASAQTAQRFLFQMQNQVDKIKNEESFKKAVVVLSSLSDLSKEMYPEDLYISEGYDETASFISVDAIKELHVFESEKILFWIEGLRTQDSILNFLSQVSNSVLSENVEKEEVRAWFSYLLVVGSENLKEIENLRESTSSFFGDTLIEAIFQGLEREMFLSEYEIETVLGLLNFSRIKFLAERWVNPNFKISNSYFKVYFEITNVLYRSLVNRGFSSEALILGRYVSSKLGSGLISGLNQEGTYEFRDEDGRVWFFTVLRESYDRIIAAISNKEKTIYLSYYSVQYNIEEKVYVASTFAPDDSIDPLNTVKFSFNEDSSKVDLNLPFSRVVRGEMFKGHKIESYEDLSKKSIDTSNIIEGFYEGVITLPSGSVKKVNMSVVQFETYVLAKIDEKDNENFRIDLKTGTDGKDGYVYLTAGRGRQGSWFHMRLLKSQENEDLEGYIVIGGWGQGKSRAYFSKVQD